MHHLLRNTLFALIVCAIITSGGYFLFLSRGADTAQTNSPVAAELPKQNIAEAQEKDRVVTSSDGLKSLTLKQYHNKDNSTTYSFIDTEGKQIYAKTLTAGSTMGIPDNAWAPGENYVFIEETANGARNYYALKANGEVFPDGQQALNIGAAFASKYTDYNFDGATGWAADTLIIVESKKTDGSTGPSFWYELPEGSFIILASHQ